MAEMLGKRCPTRDELSKIIRYMEYYYIARKKTCKIFCAVMCLLGVVMLSSYNRGEIFTIIVGGLCFFGAFMAFKYINQITEELNVIRNGDFQVVEGFVGKIGTDSTTPGVSNVVFISKEQQQWDGWFSARHENLCLGLPLLMMYVEPNKIKGGICRVFTPYMLTEEGMHHRV